MPEQVEYFFTKKKLFPSRAIIPLPPSGAGGLTLIRWAKDGNDFEYFRDWFLKKF